MTVSKKPPQKSDTIPPGAIEPPAAIEPAPAEETTLEEVSVGTPLQHVQHVRLGGSAGVRVTQQGGLTEHKRVGAVEPDDHKRVPREVLAAVRDLIEPRPQNIPDRNASALTATERLVAVYDLLMPWLDVE